jgi:chromosome segregation protein
VRLKSLEIKGFKSFADKTHISFDNQITGIIGPNGCGKSNIVDAIRWVIGEHKISALRSENLEDLVFNGSKSRNASGLAEVALTFENTRNLLPTAYQTVTIARKFYKSGESEYRLNDVTCRLKDITNLFVDTGVSTDSYAIIELGKVDEIIKDKDNSRRKILEQAAGISIYKLRKREAKLKLEATEQDLNRIEDLLFEIGNNLRTLESQAKKAEKYLQIKQEYKFVSIELVKATLEDFNATYQTLNEKQQQEVDKILEFEAKIASEEAQLQANKLELAKKEETLHAMQKAFNELTASILKLENEKSLAEQRISFLSDFKKNTETFLTEAEAQKNELDKSIQSNSKKLELEEKELATIHESTANMRIVLDEKRSSFDSQKSMLDELRRNLQAKQMKQFETEKLVAVSENNLNNILQAIKQIEIESESREKEIATLRAQAKIKSEAGIKAQADLTQLISIKDNATAQVLAIQAEIEALRTQLIDENRKLDSKQNEYNILKELIDKLEGYPDSIKYLANNSEWKTQAVLLSDILEVKPEIRVAIENYLDTYLNYYVVESTDQAYQALTLLDQNKKGKAGFFVSTSEASAASKIQVPSAIYALDQIKVDPKYQSLADHLLSNVWVVDTEQEALNAPDGAIVISKSGKTQKRTNTIKGGAVGHFEGNKIGRIKRLEQISDEIAASNIIVEEFKTKITGKQQELNEQSSKIDEQTIKAKEREVNQITNEQSQLESKADHLHQMMSASVTRKEQLVSQRVLTEQGIEETKDKFGNVHQELADLQEEINLKGEEFKVTEGEYNKASDNYNKQQLVLTRQQGKISELKNELEIRSNQLTDILTKVSNSKDQLEKTKEEAQSTNQDLAQISEKLFAQIESKEIDGKLLNETDAAYYVFRNALTELEQKVNSKRREKESAETILKDIKDRLTDMKLQISGMKERLQIEFKLDIDEVLKGPRESEKKLEELQEESIKIKKRFENLGEVNPMAVEAFKEVKGRYDFIQEQRADLVTAKDSLLATIEEVEQTANRKFLETFEQVRENFINVFKALFTSEDNCDLKLVDPENPSDTALEIYAQPKGKRPSTITQLSGGEKTLTATAFLFAIYLIKPAPFCILDEVDAPLDDANVAKFTQMIRKFSDNSQFIIVTHNKQTMASVDVIYGVTMQEAGVSKLVPVDFRSLN